ncbi:MAG: MFS transporter [Anaplasma sp.]
MYRLWKRLFGLNGVAFAVLFCNAIEHYDFIIYGILNSTISKVFFAQDAFFVQGDGTYVSSLLGFLVFASAFAARPFGAVLFGYLGDRKGRKIALNISATLLVGSVLCMSLLPTPVTWGVFSPLVLTLLRVVQGLGYGAEVGGVVLMVESVERKSVRVVWVLRITFCVVGLLLGTFVVKVCETFLTGQQMHEWGWRIPFVVAVAIGLPLPYLRSLIHESCEYMAYKSLGYRENIAKSLIQNIGSVALVLVMASLSAGFFYLATVYMDLGRRASYPEYVFSMFVMLVFACSNLYISDFAKRRRYFLASLLLIIVSLYPVVYFIEQEYAIARILFSALSGIYLGWYGSFIALIFPVGARQTCFSVAYSGGYLIGALSPAICLWFSHVTGFSAGTAPAFFLTLCAVIVAMAVAFFVTTTEDGCYKLSSFWVRDETAGKPGCGLVGKVNNPTSGAGAGHQRP